MLTFVWVMAGIFAAEVLSKSMVLATGIPPASSRLVKTLDLLVNIALLCWAIAILVRG